MAKQRVGRYRKELRRIAVERLKRCDNIVALSEELVVHGRLLYQRRDPLDPVDSGEGPREGSKNAKILELLRQPNGTTLQDLMTATGWQAHSIRGFLSAVVGKKLGLKLESSKREDGNRVYQIAS